MKRQRKTTPTPFVEEKPVAKALKNLPGAPPSPALRLEQLADELSLDDLDALIEASQKRKRRKKEKRAPSPERKEEEAQPAVPAATSLTAAFQSPERVAEQKRQEFELLMQDVVYESGSSLTDLRLLEGLRGKKKKGQSVFATGFWTKLFKPPPRPGRPPADDKGR